MTNLHPKPRANTAPPIDLPVAMLAELTHRCPMRCAYCSNPVALERPECELSTAEWRGVLSQAAAMGVMQVHFSGGEPTARRDIVDLVRYAVEEGLYTNLITSGVLLDAAMVSDLARAGLEHVQLAFQDSEDEGANIVGGYHGALGKKRAAAGLVKDAGLALTANLVIHRHNAPRVGAMIDMALEMGCERAEVANVQYYGWGLMNRAALMPSRAQLAEMTATVRERQARYTGRMVIDYVIPDYHARRPKACMGGWARRFLNVTPTGKVLPCHAAETIPGLVFDTVRDRPLRDIWDTGQAFEAYRGDAWMPKDCRSCERKEFDWGGCRCQALAIAGDAAAMDPACDLSPHHAAMAAMAEDEADADARAFVYRAFGAHKDSTF
ncbi:Coenzyme PQQ synthesis protein E [Caenispirillum salinarum AK4]|uniref:PqqA peptide cyclase n=1 Tax=Caenispirillum salinarum AK4 TaxID=1238182 RepID=K9GRU6_9PROT|nr:pyrroloquinoline quinone biosynthesis protein PqqE [Caenispirillum salinarum]EKV28655.1 Coenzyme PQQ synthesis protein E [Caenispirillum salinarum AK4]